MLARALKEFMLWPWPCSVDGLAARACTGEAGCAVPDYGGSCSRVFALVLLMSSSVVWRSVPCGSWAGPTQCADARLEQGRIGFGGGSTQRVG